METLSDDTIPCVVVPAGIAFESTVDERPSDTRFTPLADFVWIGWWDGHQFRKAEARLLDLGRRGAAVACNEVIEPGREAWFCIVGTRRLAGARVRVVGRDLLGGWGWNRNRLRLQFQPRCPDDIFEVALSLLPASVLDVELN